MPAFDIRPMRRSDRDQITDLVNAHAQAVIPGATVSVNTVLSQLEREPGEFIVDPWVAERKTLVAEQRGRICAATHLLRYGGSPDVGEGYRNAGDIRWFLHWPNAPYWPDAELAAQGLMSAAVAQLDRWQVSAQLADGSIPEPGVYGVPEQWPHIRSLYERAGFRHGGRVEVVFMITVDQIGSGALPDLELRRTLGINGTRLTAYGADGPVGHIEIDTNREDAGRIARTGRTADIGNLQIDAADRTAGIADWLLAQAAQWLRLAQIDRLISYADADDQQDLAFHRRSGFVELTRTARGWSRAVDR